MELRGTFSPPYDTLGVILANAALMVSAWFLLPRSWSFTLTNPVAFPLALSLWMYADVPATNVLGGDPIRARHALTVLPTDHGKDLAQLLRAKAIVLWLVVTVPCLVAAAVTGVLDHRPQTTIATMLGILILPVGPLRVAACVGVMWPYHPRSLRWRWQHRRSWWRHARWAVLAVTPYLLVPFLCGAAAAPSFWWWRLTAPPPGQAVSEAEFLSLVALACATSALMVACGTRLSQWIATRQRSKLIAYLADPDLG